MVHRRSMMAGTVLGGVLSGLTSSIGPIEAEAGESQSSSDQMSNRIIEEVARAIGAVREEIERQYTFWEIAPIRDQQKTFLRSNGKFPDFIEVGFDVWQHVYDWHVRFQQPIALSRTAEGRYAIQLIVTTVVMRTDMAANYIGLPYDSR